jgi:hypothetical protein
MGRWPQDEVMKKTISLYHGHRFPALVISCAVWRYFRFSLSLRDVEELLLEYSQQAPEAVDFFSYPPHTAGRRFVFIRESRAASAAESASSLNSVLLRDLGIFLTSTSKTISASLKKSTNWSSVRPEWPIA